MGSSGLIRIFCFCNEKQQKFSLPNGLFVHQALPYIMFIFLTLLTPFEGDTNWAKKTLKQLNPKQLTHNSKRKYNEEQIKPTICLNVKQTGEIQVGLKDTI